MHRSASFGCMMSRHQSKMYNLLVEKGVFPTLLQGFIDSIRSKNRAKEKKEGLQENQD